MCSRSCYVVLGIAPAHTLSIDLLRTVASLLCLYFQRAHLCSPFSNDPHSFLGYLSYLEWFNFSFFSVQFPPNGFLLACSQYFRRPRLLNNNFDIPPLLKLNLLDLY
jgi:hypothetical protein